MSNSFEIAELVKTVLTAGIAWVVIMGYWPMDPTQQALTLTFGVSIINLGGAIWQRRQVTPLADPKAKDGEPLVRISGDTRSIQAPKEK